MMSFLRNELFHAYGNDLEVRHKTTRDTLRLCSGQVHKGNPKQPLSTLLRETSVTFVVGETGVPPVESIK